MPALLSAPHCIVPAAAAGGLLCNNPASAAYTTSAHLPGSRPRPSSAHIADESQLTNLYIVNAETSSILSVNSTTGCSGSLSATTSVQTTPEATEVVTTTQEDNILSTSDSVTITTEKNPSPSAATALSPAVVSNPSTTNSRLSVGQSVLIVAAVFLGFLVLSIRFKRQKTTKRHSTTTHGSMTIEETTMIDGGVSPNVLTSFASTLRRLVTLGCC